MTRGDIMEESFGFVAGKQAVDSLRKSGYKNVAYALGELVDNSIQEDATRVEILTSENQQFVGRSMRWRVKEIGILDNGNGMDATRLRRSLRLGDGDSQQNNARGSEKKQMGKFGVGLPQASISQCKRVEIWSWTEGGRDNALWTYVDLDDEDWVKSLEVPLPIKKRIPNKWLRAGDCWGESGTLIVWSNLDRCNWRTSSTIYNNSQFLIGRMYRHHISDGDVEISMRSVEDDFPHAVRELNSQKLEWEFMANDPLYLMESAFANNPPVTPAFDLAGEVVKLKFTITDSKTGEERSETVELKFSIAKKTVRAGHGYDPSIHFQALGGEQPHGKHASKNIGVSIVRERRELELDRGWAVGAGNQPWERWWGAEISFGRGMDEIFDVTNNKQHAQNLNDVATKSWSYWREGEESDADVKERLKDEDFPMYVCMTIRDTVYKNIKILRKMITDNSIQKKANRIKRHKGAEDSATKAINARKESGHIGDSDKEIIDDKEKAREDLRSSLKEKGIDADTIDFIEGEIIDIGYRTVFSDRQLDTSAFFSVEKEIGSLIVYLNSNHKAFEFLFSALDDLELNAEDMSKEQLKDKAIQSHSAVKLLLAAWARCEDEASGQDKINMQEMRRTWGRLSSQFIDKHVDSEN
jgi:hypothetical protein